MEDARLNKKNKKQFLTQLGNIYDDITFVVQFLCCRTKFFSTFKVQCWAGAGAGAGVGAGAKIRGKVEPEPELEPKLNNFGSATLNFIIWSYEVYLDIF